MERRAFIKNSVLAGVAMGTGSFSGFSFQTEPGIEVRQITSGDKQHWFGYYDKLQTDPSGRYALGMEVDVIFRSPKADDIVRIGLIDLKNDFQWKEIGTSCAWGWQQGCMLQWIPGSDDEVIWNDRQGDHYISRLVNVKTGRGRILYQPIYALSPNGDYAIGTGFNRIQNMRPGYGYAGIPDPFEQEKAPDQVGIYKINLKTGKSKLLIPIDLLAEIPHQGEDLMNYWHYFNHLLVSPDGERFVFLHRWRKEMGEFVSRAKGGFITRMVTANKNGKDLFIIDPSGETSHFIWRDPQHICAWTKPAGKKAAFYLFRDKTGQVEIVGEESMTENGHNTYVPNTNNEWILNDTYPYVYD